MSFTIPNTIEFQSEITSAEHEQNYQAIENELNSNVIRKDGSVAMEAELTLAADPETDLGAATKAYVDAFEIAGVPKPFFGMVVPEGHVVITGQTIARATAPAQAAALAPNSSSPFWVNDSTFRLPDGRDRVFMGVGTIATAIGATGGSKDAVVVDHGHGSAGAHGHGQTDGHQTLQRVGPSGASNGIQLTTSFTSGTMTWTTWDDDGATGGAHTHPNAGVSGTDKNLQPYLACQWIMRLF